MLLLSFSIFAVMSLRFKSFFICQVSCLCGFLFFLIITVRQTTPNIVTYNIVILFITHIFCGSGIQLWLEWLGAWVISGFFTHMADTWIEMRWIETGLIWDLYLGTHVWPIHGASFNMTRELFLWQGASGEYIFQDTQVEAAWFYMT